MTMESTRTLSVEELGKLLRSDSYNSEIYNWFIYQLRYKKVYFRRLHPFTDAFIFPVTQNAIIMYSHFDTKQTFTFWANNILLFEFQYEDEDNVLWKLVLAQCPQIENTMENRVQYFLDVIERESNGCT